MYLRPGLFQLPPGAFGPAPDPADALIAAMSPAPDGTREGHIRTCVGSLVSAGVWSLIDVLWVMAAHDAQAAGLNWKDPANFTLALVNAPTFTTDGGYSGDGSTSYLTTGWVPGTNGSYSQNNNHFGGWIGTNVDNGAQLDFGYVRGSLSSRTGTSVAIRNSAAATDTVNIGVSTSVGHVIAARTTSTGYEVSKNGAASTSVTRTSGVVSGANVFICARNNGAGTPEGFSTRRVQAVHYGVYIDDTQKAAIYNALATYMTAIGA